MPRDRMLDSTLRQTGPFLALSLASIALVACPSPDQTDSQPSGAAAGAQVIDPPATAAPSPPRDEMNAKPADAAPAVQDPAEHTGPWLWVRRSSAGVFEKPTTDRDGKIGYYKRGAKVPVYADRIEAGGCPKGWLRVVGGGVICSMVGTTDENDPLARFSPRQPKLDDILPYPYARNGHNGTPLYKSLPSRKQMYQYEPYLPDAV